MAMWSMPRSRRSVDCGRASPLPDGTLITSQGASVGVANVGSADTSFAGIPFRSAREARGWCGGYLGSRGRSGGADSAAHNDRMLEPQVVAATVRWFPADPVAGALPDHDVVTPGAGSQICRP